MRPRVGIGAFFALLAVGGGAACGFGVDLDGLFGEPLPDDGGMGEASIDGGGEGGIDASIPSIEVQQLSMGSGFGCGRRIDGTVMCWGEESVGELGDGNQASSSTPVLVKEVADAIDLGVGQHHACVVRKAGTVACWGENNDRQLGDGTTTDAPTPKPVVQLTDVQRVALGDGFSCALKKDGSVQCWGDNASGQLGDGSVVPRSQPAPVLGGLAGVTQIAAGAATACALVKGEVLCWGQNNLGQVGAPPPANANLPVKVAGLTGVTSIAASADANHFCAVLTAGDVRCWGAGGAGNLGNAKEDDSATPVVALTINDALGVTTGGGHSCAWRKSGAVACWGLNNWRQVGLGDSTPTTNVSTPLPVDGVAGVKQAAAGESQTCALLADGKHISCWGKNLGGALGRGNRLLSDLPVKVATTKSIASFGLGSQHSCAIDAQGTFNCWGNNELRQLSVTTFLATGTPTAVPTITGVGRAAGGDYFTCTLSGTQIKCWGHGQYGQLGNGGAPYIEPAPQNFGGGAAKDFGAGSNFTCAILTSSDVACAGQNYATRLGFGGGDTATPGIVTNNVPYDAGGIDGGPEAGPPALGATKISVGPGHTCVMRNGTISCWGSNDSGQCGIGESFQTSISDIPASPGTPIDIAAGGAHTCALFAGGGAFCWGANNHGQTTGAAPQGPSFRAPNLGRSGTAIVAGDDHSCALLDDKTVKCWGKGTNGQLGNNLRADQPTPVAVKNLANVKAIAARGNRTCAALTDGTAYCWGDNHSGELGDGSLMTTGTPGPVIGY